MKILFISNFYLPNEVGGAEVQLRNNIESACTYADVKLITFDAEGNDKVEKKDNLTIYRLYIPKLSDTLLHKVAKRKKVSKIDALLYILRPQIFKTIKEKLLIKKEELQDTDIINLSGNYILIPSLRMFKFLRKEFPGSKIVYNIHDHYSFGRRSKYPHQKRIIYSLIYQRILKNNINYFICPSEFLKERFIGDIKIESSRVIVIGNSVPFEAPQKPENKSNIILYAGSVEYMKGLDLLADAFITLNKEEKFKFQLYILGDGNYIFELKEKLNISCPDSFRVSGKIPHNELMAMMDQAAFVILPSRYEETFGMTLIEGFYRGALPMSSGSGALAEILNFDEELIFKGSNELAKKITYFTIDPNKRINKMKSLEQHMKKFSKRAVSEEYYNFYINLCN